MLDAFSLSGWTTLIFWTVICLALEAFFSGAELAMVSVDKLKLAHQAGRGHRGAKMALWLARHPEWLFSTTLLGQNLFIVGNTVYLTFFIFDRFGQEYEFFGILLSPLILIFGEAVPKTVFQQYANRLVPIVAPVIYVFSYIASPIVWPLSRLTLLLMGGVKGSLLTGHKVTRESLEGILRDADIHRDLPLHFKDRLLKILKFTQKKARAIMTPLIEVFSLRESTTVGEAALQCREEGYSIFPVFFRRAYNLVGMVSFYDLLLCEDKSKPLSAIMRDPVFVPESMGLKDLFFLFKERKEKFAIVVDEYGVAVGVVTLEDVQEEIVGEIEDEFDDEDKPWRRQNAHQFLVEGRAEIDRLNDRFGWELPKKNYETLTGFLTDFLGKIPQNGDMLSYGRLKFTVTRSTPKTVEEVTVDYD